MIIYFDTETHPFAPGRMAPPLVCLQWCIDGGPAFIATTRGDAVSADGLTTGHNTDPLALFSGWLAAGHTLVGHNVAFDMAVMAANYPELLPEIFRAYRENRVTDTMLRAKLADIARGRYRTRQYDLGSVAGRYGFPVNKADPWRRRYRLLDGVPLSSWSTWEGVDPADEQDVENGIVATVGEPIRLFGRDAIRYALDDAVATRTAYQGQAEKYGAELLVNEFEQARKFFGLRLAEVWGIRTSTRGVDDLERGAAERRADLLMLLQEPWTDSAGRQHPPLVRPDTLPCPPALKSGKPCRKCGGSGSRPNPKAGSRDTASAAVRLLDSLGDGNVRLTKTGIKMATEAYGEVTRELPANHPVFATEEGRKFASLDSDACNDSGDPLLEAYAEASSLGKVLSNDVPALRKGTREPIHTHFDLVETGRTSSAGPNIQNPRRIYGVRECFVPRGWNDE